MIKLGSYTFTFPLALMLTACGMHEPTNIRTLASTNTAPSGPNILVAANANLLKPLARVLLPVSVPPTGEAIARITDAIYCGTNTNSAIVVVQITRAGISQYAPHLSQLEDCTNDPGDVLAKHTGQAGFSGTALVRLDWDGWQLTRRVTQVALDPSAGFTPQQVQQLRSYNDVVATAPMSFDAGSVHKQYALALKFLATEIVAGIFDGQNALPDNWWMIGDPPIPQPTKITNVFVFLKHSFIGTLLEEHPDQLSFPIPHSNAQLTTLTYSLVATNPTKVETAGMIKNIAQGVDIHLSVDWSGSPLSYYATTAVPDPNTGITQALAAAVRTAVDQSLQRKQFVPATDRSFNFTFHGQQDRLRLTTYDAEAGGAYLLLSGNGELILGN